MKKIVLILLLGLFTTNNYSQKTGWEDYGLKGKVKSMRKIPFEFVSKFGKMEKKRKNGEYHVFFAQNGNILKRQDYFPFDGKIFSNYTYKYDDKNFLIEENEFQIAQNYKTIYKYNDKGLCIEGNVYRSNGSLEKSYKYEYDNKGYLIEKSYNFTKYYYTNNDKGNPISIEIEEPLSLKEIFYEYNDKGDVIKIIKPDAFNSYDKEYTIEYKYDNQGHWVEKIVYNNDKVKDEEIDRIIEYY